MNHQPTRKEIAPGVYFNTFIDDRYKTNRISVHLFTPLDKAKVTEKAVLSQVLEKGSAQYPSLREMNDKLAEMYGAIFSSTVYKIGDWQGIGFQILSIANSFALNGEDILAESLAFLKSMLFSPKVSDKIFDTADVLLEKTQLKEAIEAEINDKRSYARNQCVKALCGEEDAYTIPRLGYIEDLPKINETSLWSTYEELFAKAHVEIFATGADDFSLVEDLGKYFSGDNQRYQSLPEKKELSLGNSVQLLNQSMEVAQAKLVLGFKSKAYTTLREDLAMRLMLVIFGAGPSSKLFTEVREKKSLCYYCSASFDLYRSLMLVESGIAFAQKNEAVSAILEQLEAMKAGLFSDEDIEVAKRTMRSSLESVYDSPRLVEGYRLGGYLSGLYLAPEEKITLLLEITRDEIITMAQNIHLDLVYCLAAQEEEA